MDDVNPLANDEYDEATRFKLWCSGYSLISGTGKGSGSGNGYGYYVSGYYYSAWGDGRGSIVDSGSGDISNSGSGKGVGL